MLNKLPFLFLFCTFSFFVNAQNIHLQKNQTFKKIEIKLPKRLRIEYKDSGNTKSAIGKVFRYEFPYLFMKRKTDTLKVDVKNILLIQKHNKLESLNVAGAIFFPFITTLFLLDIASGEAYPIEKILVFPTGFLSYYLIKSWPYKYDTKTEWSFY